MIFHFSLFTFHLRSIFHSSLRKHVLEVSGYRFLLFGGKRWLCLLQGLVQDVDCLRLGLLLSHPDAAPIGRGRKQCSIEIPVAHLPFQFFSISLFYLFTFSIFYLFTFSPFQFFSFPHSFSIWARSLSSAGLLCGCQKRCSFSSSGRYC